MKYFSFLLLLLFSFLYSSAAFSNSQRTLTIYSSQSFAKDWMQTGNPIKRAFEFNCNCKIEFVTLSDTNAALSRLMLESNKSSADLIVGLDMGMIAKAKSTDLFTKINASVDHLTLPIKWTNTDFIPYGYGYTAFVYNAKKLKNPPKSFQELLDRNDIKIVIQDPRSSPIGLSFLTWLNLVYKDKSYDAWRKLKGKILTVTKGWSESYSLFSYGEADMVMSYNTSPVYHMMAEDNYDIKAAEFTEGHYLHLDLIGKLKNAPNPDLADQFVNFLLSKTCQRLLPINNFNMPVIDLGTDLPDEYKYIFTPAKVFTISPEELQHNRKSWIQEWLQALSKG